MCVRIPGIGIRQEAPTLGFSQKTLYRKSLLGIPPAPAGVTQADTPLYLSGLTPQIASALQTLTLQTIPIIPHLVTGIHPVSGYVSAVTAAPGSAGAGTHPRWERPRGGRPASANKSFPKQRELPAFRHRMPPSCRVGHFVRRQRRCRKGTEYTSTNTKQVKGKAGA